MRRRHRRRQAFESFDHARPDLIPYILAPGAYDDRAPWARAHDFRIQDPTALGKACDISSKNAWKKWGHGGPCC